MRAASPTVGLGFGTYALWMLRWEDALELIARTGYDGVELAAMAGWPTAPERLSRSDRARMRQHLADSGLEVPALLESLQIHPLRSRGENLDRLRRAIDLGADVSPGKPPAIETVLGRKPAEWEEARHGMVDEIGEWVRVAADAETVICFKPHVSHAVNDIERSLWLTRQIDSPHLRCTFDYSHLWLAGLDLEDSLEALLPVCHYVHLKDAGRDGDGHRFLLPGDGQTDYPAMFRKMRELGFQGYATVEISSQIHRDDRFEPIPATRTCYERMSAAIEQARLIRPRGA
ncbi:MAG: sugar phosphate isomerase/epimerase [Bryobacterales bacterium]|nr:sugar phosphate isomerase/epimerase [Bryobacterales bacterium]